MAESEIVFSNISSGLKVKPSYESNIQCNTSSLYVADLMLKYINKNTLYLCLHCVKGTTLHLKVCLQVFRMYCFRDEL